MNYLQIDHFDIANGPGVRVILWLAGCPHHCEGCHNPESWDSSKGELFTIREQSYIKDLLKSKYLSGLTLTGGDPLVHAQDKDFIKFLKELKEEYPDKTIWCYTGWYFEEVKDLEILNYIDVLVDGPFEIEKRDITLKFKGSTNQRLIDVQKSREKGETILWEN